jgi:Spy/CpxP family protein refolding chaperone
MKRATTMALVAAGVLACAVQPAAAQRPPMGGGGLGGLGGLAQNPGVAKELKLTDEQTTQLKEAVAKIRENHKDDFAKLQDASREERREKTAELMKTISPETEKAVAGVLKPEQMKRLKQIEVQTQGIQAFLKPEVQDALKLTKEQKEKVKDLDDNVKKSMEEAFKDGRGDRTKMEEAMKKVAEARKEAFSKASGLLDDTQKKAWKDLTGEPFEVKFERNRPNAPPKNNNI